MLAVRENSGPVFPDYVFSPDPFSYFRPVPKLFFYFFHNVFHENFIFYRIFTILLHILCVILVYKIAVSLNYNNTVAFISALMFSVLTSHTEALFFINCVTELLSAFFILTGLYLYSEKKYDGSNVILIIIAVFTLALFSKENAICYIPLILLFYFFKIKRSPLSLFLIIFIPVFLYSAIRIYSEFYLQSGNLGATISSMDFNPLKLSYKIVHYFIMMMFPVKVIFELIGFERLEYLINIYRNPGGHIAGFILFGLFILTVLIFFLRFVISKLKSELVLPLLFILISISIYLFSFSTAERYSYLPSAGFCLLLGILYDKIKSSFIYRNVFILFIFLHLFSLIQRSYRYNQAADFSRKSIINLNEVTKDINEKSEIFLVSLPPKKYGIYFLNVPNFYYNWKYNFPERNLDFRFEYNGDANKSDAVLDFDMKTESFVRIK